MKIVAVVFVLFFAQHDVLGQGQSENAPKSSQLAVTEFTEPGPVQLLDFGSSSNKTVTLKPESIEKLFLNPAVSDRCVVVVSIAGAFRKGKSFLLNYMLRYLYANVSLSYLELFCSLNFVLSTNQLRNLTKQSMLPRKIIGWEREMSHLKDFLGSRARREKQRELSSGLMFSSTMLQMAIRSRST